MIGRGVGAAVRAFVALRALAWMAAVAFVVAFGVHLCGCAGLDLTALKSAARTACGTARASCALVETACAAGGEAETP